MFWNWVERNSATFYLSTIGAVAVFLLLALGLAYGMHQLVDRGDNNQGHYDSYYSDGHRKWHHRD